MIENEKKLKELLLTLNNEGILKDLILIGSWAMVFYRKLFRKYNPTLMTSDIDFYVPNPKRIHEKKNIVDSFKKINYDISYDTLSNKSKFISPDGFTVEFLTKLNRERLSVVELGKTNVYAETLPYVDIFSGNCIEIVYYGMTVKVVHPAVYVLQKLLINNQRNEKAEKDILSISELMLFINRTPNYLKDFKTMFNSLPKPWRKKIEKAISDNNLSSLFN